MASKISPDKTLQRYKIQAFKATMCKSVPFEELDYSIYKPSANMVAFQTTEARLPFWIKALLCRYHESPKYNVKQDLTETRLVGTR